MSGAHHPPLESGTALPPASKVPGPYRAEFGAIHHEDNPGFLFTLSPPTAADEVARALNLAHAAENRPPDRDCVSLLADLDAGKPVGLEAAATIRALLKELAASEARTRAPSELASIQRGDETLPFPVHIAKWPREDGEEPCDEIAFVLSLASKPWVLQQVWGSLKMGGAEFPARAEAEFAIALHWLVVHVLTPGSGGVDTIDDALKAMRSKPEPEAG
jgi:hypothetical protein